MPHEELSRLQAEDDLAVQGLTHVSPTSVLGTTQLFQTHQPFDPDWTYDPTWVPNIYAPTAAEMHPDLAPATWPPEDGEPE